MSNLSRTDNILTAHGRMTIAAAINLLAEVLETKVSDLGLVQDENGLNVTVILVDAVAPSQYQLKFLNKVIAATYSISGLPVPSINIDIKYKKI